MNDDIKNLLKALAHKPIAYNPIFRHVTGSTLSGILLAQVLYWRNQMGHEFYKTNEDFMFELHFTPYELKKAKAEVKKTRIVLMERRGVPAKTFYDVDFQALANGILGATEKAESIKAQYNAKKALAKAKKDAEASKDASRAKYDQLDEPNAPNYVDDIRPSITEITTEITTENKLEEGAQKQVFAMPQEKKPVKSKSKKIKKSDLSPSARKIYEQVGPAHFSLLNKCRSGIRELNDANPEFLPLLFEWLEYRKASRFRTIKENGLKIWIAAFQEHGLEHAKAAVKYTKEKTAQGLIWPHLEGKQRFKKEEPKNGSKSDSAKRYSDHYARKRAKKNQKLKSA